MITLPEDASEAEKLAALEPDERNRLAGEKLKRQPGLADEWSFWSREAQREPKGSWQTWLIMAGRGFGKTRAGAEWVRALAESHDSARIALVAATIAEARAVMIEGESGLLAVCSGTSRPRWEPSLGRLTWPGGAQAFVYSAAEPDSLRGPQHHGAWADEIAKWPAGEKVWDNLKFGLRLGREPKAVATTTPRPVPLLRRLLEESDIAVTRGRTSDNRAHLPSSFVTGVTQRYGGTRLGRQELDGELILDVEGSLWPRALIEQCRAELPPLETLRRIVVGVDPPASAEGDACGIVVVGVSQEGIAYVLADHSERGLSPERWAQKVADAYELHQADRVIAEKNMGGEMVESVLRGAAVNLPLTTVSATRGKAARAEPVAALFGRKRARFAGAFPDLEDELSGLTTGGAYEGPGRSPDRADAMVWAMSELMLGPEKGEPKIRRL